jgi:phosphoglycerate dehydrogenase-like enzyme
VPLLHFYLKQRHFVRRGSWRLSAALDVTDPEPLGADSPLWARPNVFITPHIAGSAPASVRSSLALIRAQVERFCAGEPLLNMITGEY